MPAIWTMKPPQVSISENSILLDVALMRKSAQTLIKLIGGRYVKDLDSWTFPKYIHNAVAIEEAFETWGLQQTDEYMDWRHESPPLIPYPLDDAVYRVYKQLYPFQKEAVNWLMDDPYGHRGSLLALSPGLGKTVVALTAAYNLSLERVLIVAPLSLLGIWKAEAEHWFGALFAQQVTIVHGTGPAESGWTITNYETVTLGKNKDAFLDAWWDVLILDESVMVKNRKTARFDAIKALRNRSNRIWELSGSPITRHPNDLWAQFHLIDPKAFTSYWRFTNRYCVVDENVWGTSVVGSANRDIQSEFRDLLFVRHQEDVLPDLPDMIFQNIDVELTPEQRRLYDPMEKHFITKLSGTEELDAPTKLAQLLRLQQITSCSGNLPYEDTLYREEMRSSAKHDALMALLDAEDIEFPLLVWTHWIPGARILAARMEKSGYRASLIQGGMTDDERSRTFAQFLGSKDRAATADTDILVLSLGVGKFGHTLNQTRTVAYLDKTWNADDYIQSLHRVRRIGLTHSPRVLTFSARGTVDDLVEENLAGKMAPISQVTNADLAKLLQSLRTEVST